MLISGRSVTHSPKNNKKQSDMSQERAQEVAAYTGFANVTQNARSLSISDRRMQRAGSAIAMSPSSPDRRMQRTGSVTVPSVERSVPPPLEISSYASFDNVAKSAIPISMSSDSTSPLPRRSDSSRDSKRNINDSPRTTKQGHSPAFLSAGLFNVTHNTSYSSDMANLIYASDLALIVEDDVKGQDLRETDAKGGTPTAPDNHNIEYSSTSTVWGKVRDSLLAMNGTMPSWSGPNISNKYLGFAIICLRGYGQVFFMNNPVTGLLIFVGLCIQSIRISLHGLIGVVCSNAVALMLGFDQGLVQGGLFGYNGVLCGLALATFDSSEIYSGWNIRNVVAVVCTSAASSVLFVALGKLVAIHKTPPFTMPFNVALLVYMVATAGMDKVSIGPVRTPQLPTYTKAAWAAPDALDALEGILRGVGQVFLAGDLVPSLLILLGLAVCSRITAAAALCGSAVGLGTALLMGQSTGSVSQGLFGYNASLTSAAIFGMFYAPSASSCTVAVAAAAMATVGVDTVGVLLLPYGLPVATLPFCFTATLLVLIQGTTAALIAVPLETMTIPEDHWARLAILRRMFSFLKATLDQRCAHTPEFLRYFRFAADSSAVQGALGRAAQLHAAPDGRVQADDIHGTLARADPGADPAVVDLLLRKGCCKRGADLRELGAMLGLVRSASVLRRDVEAFFAVVDADESGGLSLAELEAVQRYLGAQALAPDQLAVLAALIGASDSDDEVSVEALIQVVINKYLDHAIAKLVADKTLPNPEETIPDSEEEASSQPAPLECPSEAARFSF